MTASATTVRAVECREALSGPYEGQGIRVLTTEPVVEVWWEDQCVHRFRHHAHGGGLVEETATVEPSVYVDLTAMVCDRAQVRGFARLGELVRVEDDAIVSGHAVLGNGASVRCRARVGESAKVFDSVVTDDAVVEGIAVVSCHTEVCGATILRAGQHHNRLIRDGNDVM